MGVWIGVAIFAGLGALNALSLIPTRLRQVRAGHIRLTLMEVAFAFFFWWAQALYLMLRLGSSFTEWLGKKELIP